MKTLLDVQGSKWDIFQLDTNKLPDGELYIKTTDGIIVTSKNKLKNCHELIQKNYDQTKSNKT